MKKITLQDAQLVVEHLKNRERYAQQKPLWKDEGSSDFSPSDFSTFLEHVFLHGAIHDPEMLTSLGIFEALGVREHNAYVSDYSVERILYDTEEQEQIFNHLKNKVTYASLNPSEKISYDILYWMLGHDVAGKRFLFHDYVINQMDGIIFDFTLLFTSNHPLEQQEDFDAYHERLKKIPQALDQTLQVLALQKERAILPPVFTIKKIIDSITKFLPDNPAEHIFYTHLADAAKSMQEDTDPIFLDKVLKTLESLVYPAYQRLQDAYQQLLQHVEHNDGVWALPDGDAYYAYMLKGHTTTELAPEEVHAIGLREVASIQQEMRKILRESGGDDPQKSLGQLMQEFSKDPKYYYPNTNEGRAQCLADYVTILERSRTALQHLFDLKPKSPLVIKRVPEHEEDGQPGAYYVPPTLDGSRPGIFFANLRSMDEVPKYHMETLTIHEGEPGHHFQIALQQEMALSTLRKISSCTAFDEGWALYAEKLTYEEHFYSSPASKLGHFQDELLRAVRLVVDTGIHYKRWSRDEAIAYMRRELGYQDDAAVIEVERYFVLPGQACAYKIGQLKILELRAYARKRLGTKFDVKEFHNVILTTGSVPLTVLEKVIHDYVIKSS